MARALEDDGHCLRVTKPLQLKRWEAGNLPDPGQCTDCLLIVNDRSDGVPRTRLALSNGASWDLFARVDELAQPSQAVTVAQHYDLAPLVHAAVAEMLPSLQAPTVRVVQQPAIAHLPAENVAELQEGLKNCATSVLEIVEHVNRLLNENADLMARVDYLERVALAKVEAA